MITFEELLNRDGVLVYKTKGVSMEPMLRQNRDLVIIRTTSARLKKYDVALYKRDNEYVLHRVIDVKKGYYLFRGDNTYVLENVPDKAVLGILTGFQRKGRKHDVSETGYRLYVRVWSAAYPLRKLYLQSCNKIRNVSVKWGIIPLIKRLVRHE